MQWQLPVLRGQNTRLREALQDLRTDGATAVAWAWLAGELAQLHPSACPRPILTMSLGVLSYRKVALSMK